MISVLQVPSDLNMHLTCCTLLVAHFRTPGGNRGVLADSICPENRKLTIEMFTLALSSSASGKIIQAFITATSQVFKSETKHACSPNNLVA